MKVDHTGKVAIVTGGSRGIGRAIARGLVRAGASVMIVGRKEPALVETATELGARCAWIVGHVADEDAADRCVTTTLATFGRIDHLVNNAAVNPQWGPTLRVDAGMAAKMAQVNLWAPLMWSQLVWGAALRDQGGAIVNISSIGGSVVSPTTGFYNASKAGLDHLTRQLATEFAPSVRVNTVAPGLVETDMSVTIPAEQRAELLAAVPAGRLGTPSDIADAVSFLLSDHASWITGAILCVDGGAHLSRTT